MTGLKVPPNLIELESWDEVPEQFASDADEADFWSTHSLGEGILKDGPLPPDELDALLPRRRDVPTSIRFDGDTLSRVRALAARRGLGYQTLLKQFVCERLYEEEKREGILS